MTAADGHEVTPAQVITRDWMKHLGYTPAQIGGAEAHQHDPECEWTGEYWQCLDEDGRSYHPVRDEVGSMAALVMFVLEHRSNLDAVSAAAAAAVAESLKTAARMLMAEAETEAARQRVSGCTDWDRGLVRGLERAAHEVANSVNQDAPSALLVTPVTADRVASSTPVTVETPEALRGAERVWVLPEIPEDVTVQDVDGKRWVSAYGGTHWINGEGGIRPVRMLIAEHGPLTEVRDGD